MLVLLVELVEITWTQLGLSVLPHQATRLHRRSIYYYFYYKDRVGKRSR